MRERGSYVAKAVIAGGAIFYAVRLSRLDRGIIDWMVLGLLAAWMLWMLVQAGRRLHRTAGGWGVWHLQRTLLFWILGVLNTALARPEAVGGWKSWLGWLLLVLAVLDTVALIRKEYRGRPDPPS